MFDVEDEQGGGGSQDTVLIRIANQSQVKMDSVVVRFPVQTEDYGNIAPGEVTNSAATNIFNRIELKLIEN